MSDLLPLVTVVMPARNEARDIGRALEAVVAQDYPHDRMQVLVVEGSSADRTAAIAESMLLDSEFADGRVIANPEGSTPSNLNRGLAATKGEYLCRVDARSLIPPDYLRRCVDVLRTRPEVAVVGGGQAAVARDSSMVATGIARALNNRWSTGLSRYRRRAASGPSDTVYLGAFRTSQLRSAGGWDEKLPTNQDFDLNTRMSSQGSVWFESGLFVRYLPRATFDGVWAQYARFGRAKVRYWRTKGEIPRPRQWIGLVGPWITGLAIGGWILRGTGRGRSARLGVSALTLAGGLLALDHLGSDQRTERPSVRLAAAAAIVVYVSGWTWGAMREALSREQPGSRNGTFLRRAT